MRNAAREASNRKMNGKADSVSLPETANFLHASIYFISRRAEPTTIRNSHTAIYGFAPGDTQCIQMVSRPSTEGCNSTLKTLS